MARGEGGGGGGGYVSKTSQRAVSRSGLFGHVLLFPHYSQVMTM